MFKLVVATSFLLAGATLPATAALADQIDLTAPAGMSEAQMRDWSRLERQGARLVERIADDETRVADERSEVARAQAKLAAAQAKVQEEERELERAQNRLGENRAELAEVEARMVSMGGTKPEPVLPGR